MKLYEAGKFLKALKANTVFVTDLFPNSKSSIENSLADQQNDNCLLGNIMDQRVSSLVADHNQLLGGLKNLELTPLILTYLVCYLDLQGFKCSP